MQGRHISMNRTHSPCPRVHVSLCNTVTTLSMLWLSCILGHENNKEGTAIKIVVIITYICK